MNETMGTVDVVIGVLAGLGVVVLLVVFLLLAWSILRK